jgi:protoporphyrinogen IX oxidase
MLYNYIKSLHLIFVITWFAGLFYIPRLFVYHIEALNKENPERDILSKQLRIMTKRLWYIITWPSAVLATIFAVWLLVLNPYWLEQSWMHVKLAFVFLLFIYHFRTHYFYNKLQDDIKIKSSAYFRVWNEGATIILFAVVFLVILKTAFDWVYGVLGIVGLSVLLMLGFKYYKKVRDKSKGKW